MVGLLGLVLLLVVVAAATYARLTQGPVSLAYFNDRIEQAIASELPDMKVKLGNAFLAIDPKTGVPQVRFNNILISDANGNRIASAPQAGVALDKTALLMGRISARNLELIGPHISARRNVDGSLELGVNGTGDEPQANAGSQTTQGKTDQASEAASAPQSSGAKLLQIFDQPPRFLQLCGELRGGFVAALFQDVGVNLIDAQLGHRFRIESRAPFVFIFFHDHVGHHVIGDA